MANIKITDLTAYTDPESTDVLPIVDITNDETKQVSIADLMENAGAGTEALPGIAFDGDPNTGIYRPGADQIAISTAGTQRILIDDSGVVTVAGDLTVNGTTTTVNSTTVTVDDKNIELGSVGTPTDTTADGGGITLKGATDKTLNWVNSTDSWTSSENVDLASGKTYKIDGTDVLSGSTLGSGVTASSLTSVGNLTDLTVAGDAILDATDATLKIKAGTAGTKGALQFTFNTDSTVYGALDLDYNDRTTTGLRLFSGYPLTLETSATSLPIVFKQGSSNESARLDNTGRFLLGTNVNTTGGGGFYAQTAGTSQAEASILQIGYIDAVGAPIHKFIHDRATTVGGTNTSVVEDDKLGELQFWGADGTGYVQSAQIIAEVDGTPGTDAMPGRLVFSTTTTNSPTARMTIKSDGNVGVATGSPTELLTVGSTSLSDSYIRVNSANNTEAGIKFYSDVSAAKGYNIGYEGDGNLFFIRSDSSGTVTDRLVIDDSGNVGINQTSPTQLLDVNGDALINGLTIGMGAGSLAGNTAIGDGVLGNATTGGDDNTGVGYITLQDLTTGSDNTAIGSRAGANITEATANVFVGRSAGLATTTGNINVGIGHLAFDNNTTGQSNVAVGQRALSGNVAGNNSVAIGTNSQRYANNTTTEYNNTNVSVGYESLRGSTTPADNTGNQNTTVGYQSGIDTTSGSYNTFLGYRSGYDNQSGEYITAVGPLTAYNCVALSTLTAIGYQSQRYANNTTTGTTTYNTSVGHDALRFSSTPADNTGIYNTAVGHAALQNVSSGGYNAGFGGQALNDLTTGLRNTAVGYAAGSNITTADDNVVVGQLAFTQASVLSNCVAVGFEAQRYADSTTTAKDANNTSVGYRALRGSTTAANNTGTNNTAVGHAAMQGNTSGFRNTVIGVATLLNNTTGADNTAIGHNAGRFEQDGSDDANRTNCSYLGYDTRASGDNQVQLGNSSTTTYAYGSVQDRSDERDKTDIRDTVIGLDFINTLRPVDFRWDMRDDYFDTEIYEEEETETIEVPNPAYVEDSDEPEYIEETVTKMVTKDRLVPVPKDGSRKRNRFHHGLIAQEVKAAADAAGVDFAGYQDHSVGGGKDVLTLGYSELIAPLIKAVQELSAENAALKARLDALEGA